MPEEYTCNLKSIPKLMIFVVSSVDENIPSDTNKTVPFGKKVDVFAVVKAKIGNKDSYYLGYEGSDLPIKAKIQGKEVDLKRWDSNACGELDITWHRIMPYKTHNDPKLKAKERGYGGETEIPYTNVWANDTIDEQGVFHKEGTWIGFDTIEYYSENSGTGWRADVDNTLVGTTRYQVDIKWEDKVFSSPGKIENSTKYLMTGNLKPLDYDRGIKSTVRRITRCSSNSNKFISYIEAYKMVPWIYGSGPEGSSHQTERFVGFDCADLMVGAARCAEITGIKYTNANSMAKNMEITHPVGSNDVFYMEDDGTIWRVKDKKKVSIPFGTNGVRAAQLGDFIFFDWEPDGTYNHTTVIYSNDGQELDQNTRLIMADHDGVSTEFTLGDEAMKNGARFVLRRWKSLREDRPIYILLSGFLPWKDYPYNSSEIVKKLNGSVMKVDKKSVKISSIVLPVSWYTAADNLIEEIKNSGYPDIVIGFGMNPDGDKFEIETEPHNINDTNIEDGMGRTPAMAIKERGDEENTKFHTTVPEKVKDNGAKVLPGKRDNKELLLPYNKILDAINKQYTDFAIVDPDKTSGDYMCNQVHYNLFYYNDNSSGSDGFERKVMTGFVHVPGDPTISEEKLKKTVEIIVEVCTREYVKRGLLNK